MKIWLRLFGLIAVLVAIVMAIGYLLPRNYALEAAIDIEAPAEDVFMMIADLPNWQRWSSFSEERIESLKITYGTKRSGEGASQTWQDARGSGKLWITKTIDNELVEYDLNFGEFPTMTSQISLAPIAGGTRVRWTSQGSLPRGAFYGYFAILFPRQMNFEYEQSLLRLKQAVEAN